jgi:ankyrin repeat protein
MNELGADVNQATDDGKTALLAASMRDNLDMVPLLVTGFGADVNRSPASSPLICATKEGNVEMMRRLVNELGANVNHAGQGTGTTPLMVAAAKGRLDSVRLFVGELGADVNQGNCNGVTPLMIATGMKVVQWLIKNGANAQASIRENFTVADASRELGQPVEQSSYLEARARCANPDCDGAGIKKYAGCFEVFYCCRTCQLAHRSAHKADCKRRSQFESATEVKAADSN